MTSPIGEQNTKVQCYLNVGDQHLLSRNTSVHPPKIRVRQRAYRPVMSSTVAYFHVGHSFKGMIDLVRIFVPHQLLLN